MTQVEESHNKISFPEDHSISVHAMSDIVTDLETMGLAETWIDSRGRDGRVKQIEATFDPEWVKDAKPQYFKRFNNHMRQSESE